MKNRGSRCKIIASSRVWDDLSIDLDERLRRIIRWSSSNAFGLSGRETVIDNGNNV